MMFPDPAVRMRVQNEVYRYGEAGEPQVERGRLAILKRSEGRADKINEVVAAIREDPMDLIAWAERPGWMDAGMKNLKLRPEEQERIDVLDWEQYHEWLAQGLK